MTDQELRRLSRAELLEMLLSQSRECERLQKELDDVKAQLASREIRISEAGSIAEASLQLSGVFEAAQAACAQYIENIEQMKARQELVCAEMEEATRKKCAQMVAEAEAQSKDYWVDVSRRIQEYSASYTGLMSVLEQIPQFKKQD